MNKVVNLGYAVFLSVTAAIGGFLFGYDTAVISGTVGQIATQFDLDSMAQGWYVGCALIGSILGVSIAGILSDKFGRKIILILAAFLFIISAFACAFSSSFDLLVWARIVGGIGIGIVSIVSPLYISEISAAQYRGRLVSLYQLAVTVGFLGAYIVNYFLYTYSVGDAASLSNPTLRLIFYSEVWRSMLGVEFFPALLFLIIIILIPETPRWLILKGKYEESLSILERIYSLKDTAAIEMDKIKEAIGGETKASWKELLKPGILKAVIVGSAIAILGQFMGVNAVLYYGPSIFESSGLSGGDSLFYQLIVGLVNVLTTVLAVFIIDKIGRKKLVYYGVSGMVVFLLLIAFYFIAGKDFGLPNTFLLVFFLAYIFSCAISICAVIFVLLSEMYPIKVRGLAMSIAGLSLWIGTYLIGQLTPWLLENLTPAGTFILFALMCLPYIYIVWKFIPETTGKSLEEIEKHWENK